MSEDRGQRAEDRSQRTEGRGQMIEDGIQIDKIPQIFNNQYSFPAQPSWAY